MQLTEEFMVYNYALDCGALAIYAMIIGLYFQRPHVKDVMHRIYISLFTCATLTPIFDIISSVAINLRQHSAIVISSTALYYLALQGITFFFLIYVIYQLDQYKKFSAVRKYLLFTPVSLMTLLILGNDFTGFIFTYSKSEGYSRGPLQVLCYAVALFYFGWACGFIFKNRKAYSKRFFKTFINVSIINILSILLQFFIPNVLIISFGFAISMVLLFFTAQTKNAAIDIETGMMNREYFFETGKKLIFSRVPFNLILIKIQDYESITAIYGSAFSKALMTKIARSIRSYVEVGEAFKTNASSFVLLIRKTEKTEAVASSLKEIFDSEWTVNEQKISFTWSMCVLNSPEVIASSRDLGGYLHAFENYLCAEKGMIDSSVLKVKDAVREVQVENAVRRGLSEKNFEVYYQPMCTAKEQNFMTAEALLRLTDPDLGKIGPDEFITVAEHSGLMIEIGNFVLEEVCAFIRSHDMKKIGLEYIEVNLSVIQCLQPDFIESINSIINRYGIDRKYLCFEITETASNYAPEIFTRNLSQLVREGFELALDDFGTGYSNFKRMVTTDFAIIKFDKTMISQTCSSDELKKAFPQMISIFHSMGLKVVAEGVETQSQYEFLKGAGVDYIQGFYFSRPVRQKEFLQFLDGKH